MCPLESRTLHMVWSWKLHLKYSLKKMLIDDVILTCGPYVFYRLKKFFLTLAKTEKLCHQWTSFVKRTYWLTFQDDITTLSENIGWSFIKLVSAIFHYFKNNVFLGYFERNTLKGNLIYSCFIFQLFHKHFFIPELPRAARLPKTSSFEKITVCVIETMLVTLQLVQMNKARREVSQQIKHKSR